MSQFLISKQVGASMEALLDFTAEYLTGLLSGDRDARFRDLMSNLNWVPLNEGHSLSLRAAYMAGRLAAVMGSEAIVPATQDQLVELFRVTDVRMEGDDQEKLDLLAEGVKNWVLARRGNWGRDLREAITKVNMEWRALENVGALGSEEELHRAKQVMLGQTREALEEIMRTAQSDVEAIVQSELSRYYQFGMIQKLDTEELVWKKPRAVSERHCMRLHLHPDGSAIEHKIKDILRNSNYSLPSFAWKFAIGPVHPWCYCTLYRTSNDRPLPKSRARANLRAKVVAVGGKTAAGVKQRLGKSHSAPKDFLLEINKIKEVLEKD